MIINISAERFTKLTQCVSAPDTITQHLDAVFATLGNVEGKKVAIVDNSGKVRWFDEHQKPTRSPQRKYPSLLRQVMSVSNAAHQLVKQALNREPIFVSQADFQRRVSICRVCDLYDPEKKRCTKCGCKTMLKTKSAAENCPHPEGSQWGPPLDGPVIDDPTQQATV